MNSETKNLLMEAAAEIRELQRRNELLGAKLEGVEMMAMAVASDSGTRGGQPMKECVAFKIERHLSEQES